MSWYAHFRWGSPFYNMTDILKVGDTLNAKEKITSLELVEQINLFRNEEGNRAVLQHSDLLKVIRDEFEEEIGIGQISETSYIHPQNGQEYPMFELTLNQAKQILVRESKFVRKAVIAYIDELEKILQRKLGVPKTFAEALQLAANQAKELEAKQRLIAEQAPKAEYFDELVDRKLNINFRDTAKELGVKEKDFINFLLSHNYIYRDKKGQIKPIAIHVEKGLFEIKEWKSEHKVGNQTLITPKGRETFRLLMK